VKNSHLTGQSTFVYAFQRSFTESVPVASYFDDMQISSPTQDTLLPRTAAEHIPVGDDFLRRISRAEWYETKERHEERYQQLIAPHLLRRSRHEKHPVADFLFEYYSFRPSHLRRWSPGLGILLEGASPADLPGILGVRPHPDGVYVWPGSDTMGRRAERYITATRWIHNLLRLTAARKPVYGCFGLHEWAMIYRSEAPRHEQLPLRVSVDKLAQTVDDAGLRCTHYDAFRFFTESATPLNAHVLDGQSMPQMEQPGCLHANMDVYRWAFKRTPWVPSELIMDAFELTMDIRQLDMASSPYDVSGFGIDAVPVEDPAGRAEFVTQQREFHERAASLRQVLIEVYDQLLTALTGAHGIFANQEPDS